MKVPPNVRKAQIKYYEKNKEKILLEERRKRKEDPEHYRAIHNKYRLSEKGEDSRLRIYGITKKNYNVLLKKQKEVCAICNQKEFNFARTGNKLRGLAVDHCHATKKIRGLLCSNCNKALGLFQDNIDLLKKAIKYLRKDYVDHKRD